MNLGDVTKYINAVNDITNIDSPGKYYKRKDSNVSKASRKSRHKHTYAPCLLYTESNSFDWLITGKYCTICGKCTYTYETWMHGSDCFSLASSSITSQISQMLQYHSTLPVYREKNGFIIPEDIRAQLSGK